MPTVEVRNAADPEQVRRATRNERTRADRHDAIWASVLATQDGRELLWNLLLAAKVLESPFHASGSTVYYNIGRADFGRELMTYLRETHGEAYLAMEQEARVLDVRLQRSRDAAHTPRASREDE